MSKMTLNVDFICGIKILDACAEAIMLATKLDINVRFNFNDIEVIARPNVCPTALAEEYKRVLLSEDGIKMAIVI